MPAIFRVLLFAIIAVFFPLSSVLAAHHAHKEPHTQVAILMFDGVQIIDFAGPYEVFGHAGFGVVTVSEDGKAVTTAMV